MVYVTFKVCSFFFIVHWNTRFCNDINWSKNKIQRGETQIDLWLDCIYSNVIAPFEFQ